MFYPASFFEDSKCSDSDTQNAKCNENGDPHYFLKYMNIYDNKAELSLKIEVKESLLIQIKHSINPLLQWNYTGNFEQITK